MSNSIHRISVLVILAVLGAWNQASFAQEFSKPLTKLDLKDGDTVVFLARLRS